ncbi:MAG: hypothetical protein M1822_007793 [Bathelium mastoideum]|nr:MAG: hypothetical protein M1822_007793 [Bathelium mastoideum]
MTLPGSSVITFPVSSTVVATDGGGYVVGGYQAYSILGPLIQLNHKSSDLPPPNPSTTSHQASSSLTIGVKATVGALVPITVLALAAFLAILLRRRKQSTIRMPAGESQYHEKPELEAKDLPEAPQDAQVSELVASDRLHELGPAPHHELPVPDLIHEVEGTNMT